MKIHLFILVFLTINFCNSDPVQCEGVQASSIGYFSSCSSTKPFPLKVSATITLTQRYAFNPSKAWKFYLRNYKGQITSIPGCSISNPADSTYNIGINLTVGFSCYQTPRQLQQADVIQISFFDDYSSFRLIFLVPIIGYSNEQTINKIQSIPQNFIIYPQSQKEVDNQQIRLFQPSSHLRQIVQCYGIQASILGTYVNCFSSNPFPLKINTTITMNMSISFYPQRSWKFYLRNYKGQLTKVPNCILSNPTSGLYNKGSNITIGIMCTQLPRQLQQMDYIQIVFFDETSNKLIYLIPIIGYSDFSQVEKQSLSNGNLEHNKPQNKIVINHPLKHLKHNLLQRPKQSNNQK